MNTESVKVMDTEVKTNHIFLCLVIIAVILVICCVVNNNKSEPYVVVSNTRKICSNCGDLNANQCSSCSNCGMYIDNNGRGHCVASFDRNDNVHYDYNSIYGYDDDVTYDSLPGRSIGRYYYSPYYTGYDRNDRYGSHSSFGNKWGYKSSSGRRGSHGSRSDRRGSHGSSSGGRSGHNRR